ncbi:MAG: hypothetical protein HQK86_07650 [Nitrospinae bacterium]|nr:hypothetical protein [Nitrospinota bacterium]
MSGVCRTHDGLYAKVSEYEIAGEKKDKLVKDERFEGYERLEGLEGLEKREGFEKGEGLEGCRFAVGQWGSFVVKVAAGNN